MSLVFGVTLSLCIFVCMLGTLGNHIDARGGEQMNGNGGPDDDEEEEVKEEIS